MLGKDLSEALGGIAEDKIEAAANLAPVRHRRPTWVRFAACAALVALLIGVVYFAPGKPQVMTDPTGGTRVVQKPMFGIQVYAADGPMEMDEEIDEPIFAGESDKNVAPDFGLPNDGKLRMYNATTGEWELVFKQEGEKLPVVEFYVWWDEFQDIYNPYLTLYLNGEKMDAKKMGNKILVGYIGFRDKGMVGWIVTCTFEEASELEVLVTDKETGTVLLKQTMLITPAIYEKEVQVENGNGGTATELVKNEGYMIEILDEYRIE